MTCLYSAASMLLRSLSAAMTERLNDLGASAQNGASSRPSVTRRNGPVTHSGSPIKKGCRSTTLAELWWPTVLDGTVTRLPERKIGHFVPVDGINDDQSHAAASPLEDFLYYPSDAFGLGHLLGE